jgi:hypothetical protein
MSAVTISPVDKAEAAWAPAPDWVRRLAEEAERIGQRAVAKLIDYSPATVSQVLSNTYRGDLAKIELKVLGALMGETIDCPVKGEMARNVCLRWQDKPFAVTSADRTRMYHACRSGCPNARKTKGEK